MKIDHFDPGVNYSVKTPSGIVLTKCKPAAADGSSAMFEYYAHHWNDAKSNRNRSGD